MDCPREVGPKDEEKIAPMMRHLLLTSVLAAAFLMPRAAAHASTSLVL